MCKSDWSHTEKNMKYYKASKRFQSCCLLFKHYLLKPQAGKV